MLYNGDWKAKQLVWRTIEHRLKEGIVVQIAERYTKYLATFF